MIWADNAIQNLWLQVTVKATTNTGLASSNIFYFGNAIGDTGNSTTDTPVNSADALAIRNDPHTLLNLASITNVHDVNRDRLVNTQDVLIARNNSTTVLNDLNLIGVPQVPPPPLSSRLSASSDLSASLRRGPVIVTPLPLMQLNSVRNSANLDRQAVDLLLAQDATENAADNVGPSEPDRRKYRFGTRLFRTAIDGDLLRCFRLRIETRLTLDTSSYEGTTPMLTILSTAKLRWQLALALCTFSINVAAGRLTHAATIRIGNHSLLPNTANQMLLIAVAGGEQIAGSDFALIGDGGPESVRFGLPAGTPAPRFVNPAADVSLQTGIFAGNNLGQVDLLSGLGGSAPQLVAFGVLTNTGTVAADGTLAELNVDTTGFNGGTWSLNLRSPAGNTTLLNAAGSDQPGHRGRFDHRNPGASESRPGRDCADFGGRDRGANAPSPVCCLFLTGTSEVRLCPTPRLFLPATAMKPRRHFGIRTQPPFREFFTNLARRY